MTRRRAALGALLGLSLGGCVYFNALYNASQRYDDGERARLEGRAEAARTAYDDAIRKAARSFRRDPEGSWADDALFILGRASLRTGDYAGAIQALRAAAARADDEEVMWGARLYLGAALSETGAHREAGELLDEAVIALADRALEGEAFYWRGRLRLARGEVADAFADLDRAEDADSRLRVPVLFERLAHGIAVDDTLGAVDAAASLLSDSRAGVLVDSVSALARRAAHRWGPAAAASLLGPARDSDWPPEPRDRLLLERIDLLLVAGDTLAVESEAGWAARGSTAGADAARLVVAGIQLRRAEEVAELDAVRRVLLPAGGNPDVAVLVADIRRVEALDAWGEVDDPMAWFVAAEVARDRLEAPRLARGLFLRFATEAPSSPWAGKAVLAALATTPDPRSDPALRAGLEARRSDPYVAEARAEAPAGTPLGALEARLERIMAGWMARADAEALRRDLFLRGADTVATASGRQP